MRKAASRDLAQQESADPATLHRLKPSAEEIRDALVMLDRARGFRASRRLRELLRHLVESSLRGDDDRVKQRAIAVDVFGRPPDFDPSENAIVRIEVGKLRRALVAYYEGPGRDDPIRIAIPVGSYAPRYAYAKRILEALQEPRSTLAKGAPSLPPTVMVLPFVDLSPVADDAYLATAIREDLVVSLVQMADIEVVGVPDAQPLLAGDEPIAPRDVRFLIRGSVRRIDSQIRVTAQLVDTRRDGSVWAATYDRDLTTASLLDVQDDIAGEVVAHVADVYSGEISRSLIRELRPSPGTDFQVYEALLRFYHFLGNHTEASYFAWRSAAERAYAMEPDNPLVLSAISDAYRAGFAFGFVEGPDPIERVLELLEIALQKAPDAGCVRSAAAFALLHARRRQPLFEMAEKLVSSGFHAPGHVADGAMVMALAGEWERGCDLLRETLARMRHFPHFFRYVFFLRAYRFGDHAEALRVSDAFVPVPLFWRPLLRAAALGRLGRRAEGAASIREMLHARPELADRPQRYLRCFLFEDELVEDLVEGLVASGLRD